MEREERGNMPAGLMCAVRFLVQGKHFASWNDSGTSPRIRKRSTPQDSPQLIWRLSAVICLVTEISSACQSKKFGTPQNGPQFHVKLGSLLPVEKWETTPPKRISVFPFDFNSNPNPWGGVFSFQGNPFRFFHFVFGYNLTQKAKKNRSTFQCSIQPPPPQ